LLDQNAEAVTSTVAFNNKPGLDQNACQGATVKLRYTTS